MNREAIVSALFTKVSGAANFQTTSRRLKLWGSIAPADKPALFLAEKHDLYTRPTEAIPETVTLNIDLYIYTDAGADQTIAPISTLNQLIDAVENVLMPEALNGKQTLGNLVSHCWIEGKILKDAGDLDGSGVAVIPIKILVPS